MADKAHNMTDINLEEMEKRFALLIFWYSIRPILCGPYTKRRRCLWQQRLSRSCWTQVMIKPNTTGAPILITGRAPKCGDYMKSCVRNWKKQDLLWVAQKLNVTSHLALLSVEEWQKAMTS